MDLQETTFVCCIEPGLLEPMTLRLLESLRRHGGRFSDSRFIACQPRLGPPLSSATRDRLAALGGEHVWYWRPRKRDWYHYLNKAEALFRLDSEITTDWVTFLDSDMLISREPTELVADDVDFIACAPDNGLVGSTGPSHDLDVFWGRYAGALGLTLEDIPMIREHDTGTYIRLYFNSGAFSYRRNTSFANTYRDVIHRSLELNLGFPYYGEHFTDQVVLGLCVLKMGLSWKDLPIGYNLAVDRNEQNLSDEILSGATVLHYHKALDEDPSALFGRLRTSHPFLAEWLAPLGRLVDPRPLVVIGASEMLRVARGLPRAIYRKRVRLD